MSKNNPDFKALREEMKKQNGIEKIPQLKELLNAEDSLIPSLVKKQDIEKLEELALTCNLIANIIGTIIDAYIEGPAKFSTSPANENKQKDKSDRANLLKIRNNCYFNIGLIHKEKGNTMDALLYFHDVFRLSENKWQKDNLIYKAEIEIKNLLGSKSGTYDSLKKIKKQRKSTAELRKAGKLV